MYSILFTGPCSCLKSLNLKSVSGSLFFFLAQDRSHKSFENFRYNNNNNNNEHS